jgi:hypothetical protein
MAEPPSDAGVLTETVANPLPGVLVAFKGAVGTVIGVEVATFEGVEVPTEFWARISKS